MVLAVTCIRWKEKCGEKFDVVGLSSLEWKELDAILLKSNSLHVKVRKYILMMIVRISTRPRAYISWLNVDYFLLEEIGLQYLRWIYIYTTHNILISR